MLKSSAGGHSIPPGFVQALITYAELGGSAAEQEIKDEFTALFARVNANEGKEVIATSVNGKYFGFEVSTTVEEKFAAFGEALKEINGDAVPQTYADFSCLQR